MQSGAWRRRGPRPADPPIRQDTSPVLTRGRWPIVEALKETIGYILSALEMLAKQKGSPSSSLVDTSRWSLFFGKYDAGSLPEVAQSKAATSSRTVFSLFPSPPPDFALKESS